MENNQLEIDNNKKKKLNVNMDKVNKTFIIVLGIIIALLITGIIICSVFLIKAQDEKTAALRNVDYTYQKSYYELVDNVNNIDENLSKVTVSSNVKQQKDYLRKICDNCKYATTNLSNLPITEGESESAIKFINQLDGYCTSILIIDDKESLNEEQKQKLTELSAIIDSFKSSLDENTQALLSGGSIMNISVVNEDKMNEFTTKLSKLSKDSIEYPSMIFDGPFSDSLYNKEIKGLSDTVISEDSAREIANKLLDAYKITNVEYLGETISNFETYDYKVITNLGDFTMQITKRDGLLLSMSGTTNVINENKIDINNCIDLANQFVKNMGITNMESVWVECGENICYVNMAPIISDTIIYPELIKIKVSLTGAIVVGLDSQSYAYNHIERDEIMPTIIEEEARSKVDTILTIENTNLSVIPLTFGGEALAYEYVCTYDDDRYYVYIDAESGEEISILKVIQTSDGLTTI